MMRTYPDRMVCIDFETPKFKPANMLQEPIVLSIKDPVANVHQLLHCRLQRDEVYEVLKQLWRAAANGEIIILGQNVALEAWLSGKHYGMKPEIFAAYEAGTVKDLITRAKLLGVQTHGGIDYKRLPSGDTKQLRYNLADLAMEHLDMNIFHLKGDDAWRTRYGELANVPLQNWEQEAIDYPLLDTDLPLRIWDKITEINPVMFRESDEAECSANMAAFAMYETSCRGIRIDPFECQSVFERARESVNDIDLMVDAGFISPPVPSRPHSKGAQAHTEDCTAGPCHCPPKLKKDGSPYASGAREHEHGCTGVTACDCPVKMTKALPQKGNDKAKREWFRGWIYSVDPEATVALTKTGKEQYHAINGVHKVRVPVSDPFFIENPRTMKIEKEQLKELIVEQQKNHPHRLTVERYLEYQRMYKLYTSFLPGMMWDSKNECSGAATFKEQTGVYSWPQRVHGNYDVLKRSGRMSSYGGKLVPSANHQQQDVEIRPCYIADPGHLILSCDYSSLELYCAASKMKRLFGSSYLFDLLDAGIDPHGFLGAQLAYDMARTFRWSPDKNTEEVEYDVSSWIAGNSPMERYEIFDSLNYSEHGVYRAFYKHWRTFAKPVGLGFPGGLGFRTMRAIAFAMYGITISENEAKRAKELWLQLFPEFKEFLTVWMRSQRDPYNRDDNGEQLYQYVTKDGMVRRGASYTAAANGTSLQSDSAEGMRRVAFKLQKAMHVGPRTSAYPLRTSSLLAAIHDETLTQHKIHEDWSLTVAAIDQVKAIMVKEMSDHLGIQCKVEHEAMYRWRKFLPKDRDWGVDYTSYDPYIPIDPAPEYVPEALNFYKP